MTLDDLQSNTQLTNAASESGSRDTGITWSSILLLIGTIVLTIGLALVPGDVMDRLGNYGYVGVFVLTLLGSALIVIPSAAVGVALFAGKALNPWLVGLCAGVGAALGEITSYMAGYGGSEFAARSRFYPRVEVWVKRWGGLTIFLLSVIPSPLFFDLAGVAAGTMRMPFRVYLIACMTGKIIRFVVLAWVGHLFLQW